jgi:hypothetical protein
MGSGIRANMVVLMEDDQTLNVYADQRDAAAFERSEFYTDNGAHTRIRFMAWNALRRTGQTKLSWPKFDDQCIDAFPDNGEEEEVDPTQKDQQSES